MNQLNNWEELSPSAVHAKSQVRQQGTDGGVERGQICSSLVFHPRQVARLLLTTMPGEEQYKETGEGNRE